MKKLIILAVVLRLLVSMNFFHPDIKTFNYLASFLKHGVFNIYTYLSENKTGLPLKDEFVYFPLAYFSLGSYQALISPLLGKDLDNWLASADGNSTVRDPNVFKYLFVLKLPYLLLDLAVGYMLYRYFDDKGKGKKALTIWLFNPFTIILFYIFSNIDIITVALTLGSVLAVKQKNHLLASIFLGIAAGFKLYPLLFVPFLVLSSVNRRERIKLAIIPITIFTSVSLPFLSKAFIDSALISGLSTRIFNPGISIGFGETVIPGLFAVIVLFFYGALKDEKIDYLKYIFTALVFMFSFSHFHIQWLAWAAPFFVIFAVQRPRLGLTILFVSFLAFLIPPLYEDRSMSISIFRIYSTLYDTLPTPFSFIQNFYEPYNLQSIIHTVVAGGGAVLVYKIFSDKQET